MSGQTEGCSTSPPMSNNVFGPATISGAPYRANAAAAVRATDSGRSNRPDLSNTVIEDNTLNREIIKGCELRNQVACARNIP
jgi:hypothetical protein